MKTVCYTEYNFLVNVQIFNTTTKCIPYRYIIQLHIQFTNNRSLWIDIYYTASPKQNKKIFITHWIQSKENIWLLTVNLLVLILCLMLNPGGDHVQSCICPAGRIFSSTCRDTVWNWGLIVLCVCGWMMLCVRVRVRVAKASSLRGCTLRYIIKSHFDCSSHPIIPVH